MAHEAKLGLVFIGILLTVFSALVIKKLTKHGNLPPMSLNASAAKSPEGGSLTHMPQQPSPPTLVKPLNENAQPPEFAAENHNTSKQDDAGWSTSRSHPINSETISANPPRPVTPPPSLLAEPLPVAEVGDRYKAPVPYRSSYASSGDETHPAPTATAVQTPPEPTTNPFPRINAVDPPAVIDHPAVSTDSTQPYRQPDSATTSRASNEPTNVLRQTPPNLSSGSTVGVNAAQNDRFAMQPTTRPSNENPTPSYNFTPRTPLANDFTPSAAMSGVITASAPPAPFKRNGDQYTVGPNDSFWTISDKAYGSGGYFKALFELNRRRTKDSEDLKVGEVLTVPDEAIIRRMYPDLCPKPRKLVASTQQRMISASGRMQGTGRIYTVADGDTLFEIARHELGKSSRWAEIYELNHDVLGDDFDYLRTGTELILPDSPAGSSNLRGNTATRQPDAMLPR